MFAADIVDHADRDQQQPLTAALFRNSMPGGWSDELARDSEWQLSRARELANFQPTD